MSFIPTQSAVSLTLTGRALLLSVSLFLFLILNTVGAGAQTTDDHGNFLNNATNLSLGSSVAGRIDPHDDVDIFKLDLYGRAGATDVWIYTTGELDTVGGLYDSVGAGIIFNDDGYIEPYRSNFHLRRNLAPGIYYAGVSSYDQAATGNYTLHAEVVTDPGSTVGAATRLNLNTPTAGSIDSASDEDYFRIDLAANTNLFLYGTGLVLHDWSEYLPLEPINGEVLDSANNVIPVNVYAGGFDFQIRDDFGPGTYYVRVTTPSGVDSHPVPYTIHVFEDTYYTDFISSCENSSRAPTIDDPLYGCQWHLKNSRGEDINVEPVWSEGIEGQGVNIAVVDDGLDWRHEDLADNVNASLNHDYYGNNDVHHPFLHHGTHVAGVIAARDNSIGARGVAPQSTIYGYNLLASGGTDLQAADSMTRNRAVTAVSNNSWGLSSGAGLGSAGSFWELAVESGVSTGYGGKGAFYAFAGGNGHLGGANSNLSEVASYYAVTAVCAVNDDDIRTTYSEMGANLWICAPSGDSWEHRGIVTTENSDRYADYFSGTSAATPIVSGVAALMRQANPSLTWRDLKLILAASARKNDPSNPGWEDSARKYRSDSDWDRYHFNHEYGFGTVDAGAAVTMAKGWSGSLPPLQSSTAQSGYLKAVIPDASATGGLTTITHGMSLNTDIDFTEFVEVNVTFDHSSFRDLAIDLVSPSGAVSRLTVPFDTYTPDNHTDDDFIPLQGTFRFGSARHLGEDPNGVWQIRVTDHLQLMDGTFDSWSLKIYGHSSTPTDTSDCSIRGAVTNEPSNPGLVSDCETLLKARDTLEGTGISLNWSASVAIADWDGVTVKGAPARVTQLSLWDTGLRGTIPSQLGSLTALTRLSLGTSTCGSDPCPHVEDHELNRLSGPIPAELGNLSNLQDLTLYNNQLSGEIPPELGNLSNLTALSLTHNQLSGQIPTELGNLSNLHMLAIEQNQLSGEIPPELGNLSNLTTLALSHNRLSGQIPSQLDSLSNLIVLYLWGNQLSGQIPTELGNLSDLQVLSLWNNRLTGAIPTVLGNLINLEHLYLSQNQLTGTIPAELGNLYNLRDMYLWDNQLTGRIPFELGNLVNLEQLYLSENQLTGCIPHRLRDVEFNDFDLLSLPFCAPQSPDPPNVSMIWVGTRMVRIDSPIPVAATFSEPVFGFTVDDVSVVNGFASNLVGSDGDSAYTFDVTPNAIGAVTVDIAGGLAQDADGNGNAAAVQLLLGIPYDDDGNGAISRDEVIEAIGDYLFNGALIRDHVVAIIGLYLFG